MLLPSQVSGVQSHNVPSTSQLNGAQSQRNSSSTNFALEMGRLFPIYRRGQGIATNKSMWKRPSNQLQQSVQTSSAVKKGNYQLVLPNTWTHRFMCLSNPSQCTVPTPEQKRKLQDAGLGDKKITFGKSKSPSYFHNELLKSFTKLSNAGGYELLRSTSSNISQLEVIQTNPNYNVMDLKTAVTSAKIYIRPIQRELSLECDKSITEQVHFLCLLVPVLV